MQVFDLEKMPTHDQKEKNVFFQAPEFKTRIIELLPDGKIPTCEMKSYVVFYVIEGSAEVTVNTKKALLTKGQCLITAPATIAMKSKNGARIMGIQVAKQPAR